MKTAFTGGLPLELCANMAARHKPKCFSEAIGEEPEPGLIALVPSGPLQAQRA